MPCPFANWKNQVLFMPDVIINMDDMDAIFFVTDVMGIHRESVSVELTREDPGSINRTGGGIIELTVPETRSAQDFDSELLDIVASQNRPSDAGHSGTDLVERQQVRGPRRRRNQAQQS